MKNNKLISLLSQFNCIFCKKEMTFSTYDEYFCDNHPNKVFLLIKKGKAHLSWIRFTYGDKKYQAIWYLNSKKFALYEDENKYNRLLELTKFEHLTPSSILSEMPNLLKLN